MYQLIIVDDEAVIRKGLRDYIDWKSMGFRVADTFEDGKEALEYLDSHKVDVVVTDIEMAEVSGLELAKQISQSGRGTKVIIISGYKEFEYARKAVEYGVENYLLKPIRMEEVTEIFGKIAENLDAANAKEEEKLRTEQGFTELLPEFREQFFAGLLVGGSRSIESIRRRRKVLGIEIEEERPFVLADMRLEEKEASFSSRYEGENYYNLIRNICGGEQDGIISFPVCLSEDVIKVILTTRTEETPEQFGARARRQIEEKCEAAYSLLKIRFYAEIERVFPDITGITKYRCTLVGPRTEVKDSSSALSAEEYERLMQQYKVLMGTINDGDFEELDRMVDTIFRECRGIPMAQMQKLCIDLFSMLSGRLVRMGIDIWTVWNQKLNYQEFTSVQDLRWLKERTKELLHEGLRMVKEKQNISSRHFVEDSIKYMKKHYAEEISLEIVANKFFLNQTYFSRLFKQYTGTTFTNYLIELRMEKAKELLHQGKYKVYQVSQMVGYRSEKYFFRIFKQYAGCSPTEYYRGKRLDE